MLLKFTPKSLFIALLCFGTITAQDQVKKKKNQGMNPDFSIVENTKELKSHTTLLEAMKGSSIEDLLNNDGPFTVFAPSDLAFKKIPAEKIKSLLMSKNKKDLTSVLSYHIIAGKISASKILKAMCNGSGKATYTTIQGNKLTASMVGTDIILTDTLGNSAKITGADAEQCNGVIHVIDNVILPKRI